MVSGVMWFSVLLCTFDCLIPLVFSDNLLYTPLRIVEIVGGVWARSAEMGDADAGRASQMGGRGGLRVERESVAARPARPGAAAGPRQRICDGYGLQLETANMPGDHINERSCAIRDVVARDLRGASTETTGTRGYYRHKGSVGL